MYMPDKLVISVTFQGKLLVRWLEIINEYRLRDIQHTTLYMRKTRLGGKYTRASSKAMDLAQQSYLKH